MPPAGFEPALPPPETGRHHLLWRLWCPARASQGLQTPRWLPCPVVESTIDSTRCRNAAVNANLIMAVMVWLKVATPACGSSAQRHDDLLWRSRPVVVSVVDWTYGVQHMWDNHKVAAAEADEAVGDIDAVWFDPDPSSRSGRSVRVIGYSHSRRAILTVILVHRDGDTYHGANGWESVRRIRGVIGRRSDGREAGSRESAG